MPLLENHQSNGITKLLLIGDSGSGKTGALASLASAGYNLRILDLDNGLDVLRNLLMDRNTKYDREAYKRVHFITVTDPMKQQAGRLVPKQANVWRKSIELLEKWKDDDVDYGSVLDWTENDVLVIDSLTMISNAALNFVLALNGRLGQQPHQSDWGEGQRLVESLLQKLYDENLKCNVVVNCHLTYIGEDGLAKAYPNCLGKALPPKVGRYFNSALLAQTVSNKRQIFTSTRGLVELKNTAPLAVPPSYPLETGLADYFKAVRGAKPVKVPSVEVPLVALPGPKEEGAEAPAAEAAPASPTFSTKG